MPWIQVEIFAVSLIMVLGSGWDAYQYPNAFNGYLLGFFMSSLIHSWVVIKRHL